MIFFFSFHLTNPRIAVQLQSDGLEPGARLGRWPQDGLRRPACPVRHRSEGHGHIRLRRLGRVSAGEERPGDHQAPSVGPAPGRLRPGRGRAAPGFSHAARRAPRCQPLHVQRLRRQQR